MITIHEKQGRLSAWGKQANAKSIYWYSAPDNLPERNKPLDLTGKVINAVFDDGSQATVTDYCTFSPAEGTTVPADAKTVSIKAFYIAKSGKTLTATLTLPVVHPYSLQVVTAENYLPKENYYERTSALYDADTMPLDTSKYKTYCMYVKGNETEPVYAKKIDNPTYSFVNGTYTISGGGVNDVIDLSAKSNAVTDATVYHHINEPTTESFTNAVELKSTATVDGVSMSANFYFETSPIDHFELDNPPTSGSNYTFSKTDFIFCWKDGASAKPTPGLTDMFLLFSPVEPHWNTITETLTVYFTEGASGSIWLVRRVAPNIISDYETTQYNWSCSGGVVTWERVEE